MDKSLRIWHVLHALLRRFLERRFAFTPRPCRVDGPCLIISNHVTTWDPLLLSLSFYDNPIHFVASEHIFRRGLVSRLLQKLVDPIPRRKGAAGADTVMACLRRLKAGQTVCIFAEGDACWDGLSHEVFPATGKLARMSGATLVTYRLEGGYLTLPRWSKRRRRGRMRGGPVGIYPPEELKKLTPAEVTDRMNRDIFEDAWQRQRTEHIAYRGKNRAEGIELGFFLCPKCGAVGTVRGAGNAIRCTCGFETAYTEQGFLDPPEPFETLAQWEAWQREQLLHRETTEGESLFSDSDIRLTRIESHHEETILATGTLCQYPDSLACAGESFPLDEIGSMAMVKANILLLTVGDNYYELRAKEPRCLRKYLLWWETRHR